MDDDEEDSFDAVALRLEAIQRRREHEQAQRRLAREAEEEGGEEEEEEEEEEQEDEEAQRAEDEQAAREQKQEYAALQEMQQNALSALRSGDDAEEDNQKKKKKRGREDEQEEEEEPEENKRSWPVLDQRHVYSGNVRPEDQADAAALPPLEIRYVRPRHSEWVTRPQMNLCDVPRRDRNWCFLCETDQSPSEAVMQPEITIIKSMIEKALVGGVSIPTLCQQVQQKYLHDCMMHVEHQRVWSVQQIAAHIDEHRSKPLAALQRSKDNCEEAMRTLADNSLYVVHPDGRRDVSTAAAREYREWYKTYHTVLIDIHAEQNASGGGGGGNTQAAKRRK